MSLTVNFYLIGWCCLAVAISFWEKKINFTSLKNTENSNKFKLQNIFVLPSKVNGRIIGNNILFNFNKAALHLQSGTHQWAFNWMCYWWSWQTLWQPFTLEGSTKIFCSLNLLEFSVFFKLVKINFLLSEWDSNSQTTSSNQIKINC